MALRIKLQEMSSGYLPLLRKLEGRLAREMERKQATVIGMRRMKLQREGEEMMRVENARARLKVALEGSTTYEPLPVGAVTQWRERWFAYRTSIADASGREPDALTPEGLVPHLDTVSIDQVPHTSLPLSVEDTLEWVLQVEAATPRPPEPGSAASALEPAADPLAKPEIPIISKPDPFVVAAPMYKQSAGVRLVCRSCDTTLSRGVRGAYLFLWNDNYHLSLNDELLDTLLFKEIDDASELVKSPWKRAKAACPCCGENLGSLGVTTGRLKVLLKGSQVAWRRGGDSSGLGKRDLLGHASKYVSRPLGVATPTQWLLDNAGLQTHQKRWVLDSTVLHKLTAQAADEDMQKFDSTEEPPTTESLVRTSIKRPSTLSESMARIGARSAALEAINMMEPLVTSKSYMDALSYVDNNFDSGNNPTEPKETPISQSNYVTRVVLRFAILSKLAQAASVDKNKDISANALLKTPKFDALTRSCKHFLLTNNNPAIDLISARTLCSAARLLYHHPTAVMAITRILSERKAKFGPVAGAFGRSAEYLQVAMARIGTPQPRSDAAVSLHPTPGGRFGVELSSQGFSQLFCTYGNGRECAHRATHCPPEMQGKGDTRRDAQRGAMPIFCRHHAPPGSIFIYDSAGGVIPPSEERGFHSRPRFGRRNMLVDIPDPGATEYGEPDPGTLYLGKEWESNVKVVYSLDELKEAEVYLQGLIRRAEELMKSHPNGLPSPETAVGIDVEWKPEFVYDENNRVCSVIQVATRDQTFVFDALKLAPQLHPVLLRLLKSKAILKVGHGLSEDFARMAQWLSSQGGEKTSSTPGGEYFPIESILELGSLYSKAENKIFAHGAKPSLAGMVDAALGVKLDKRCQMTDWERRPLSPAQVRYAATDAACGISLMDIFRNKLATAAQVPEIDLSEYLIVDDGSTKPQRAHAQQQDFFQGRSETVFPSSPEQKSVTPLYHQPLRYQGMYLRTSRYGQTPRFGPVIPRPPAKTRRRVLTATDRKRYRELKMNLIAQGVRVDEHAKLEGLEVATGHLRRTLMKVVSPSLNSPQFK